MKWWRATALVFTAAVTMFVLILLLVLVAILQALQSDEKENEDAPN